MSTQNYLISSILKCPDFMGHCLHARTYVCMCTFYMYLCVYRITYFKHSRFFIVYVDSALMSLHRVDVDRFRKYMLPPSLGLK
jgi:hypothetical protein